MIVSTYIRKAHISRMNIFRPALVYLMDRYALRIYGLAGNSLAGKNIEIIRWASAIGRKKKSDAIRLASALGI